MRRQNGPAARRLALLLLAMLVGALGCASLERNLKPMTDAEAEDHSRVDPHYAGPIPTPWERARHDQERRYFEDLARR